MGGYAARRMSRSLPVPLRALAGPLTRAVRQIDARGGVGRLVQWAREAGLSPLSVFPGPAAGPAQISGTPAHILVHEPADPAQRAACYASAAGLGPVLLLSTREWEVWSGGLLGRQVDPSQPSWGAPLPVVDEDDVERRRRRLRQAGELLWWDLPRSLHRDGGDPARVAEGLRSVCARETLPSRFPPIPPVGADGDAIFAASFGVAHATFAGEVAHDLGSALEPDDRAEPAPNAAACDLLTRTLLADLPAHIRHEMIALYLLPGPWGTLHAHQLVAVVADDAPLHRAAALRRRLSSHLGMTPRALRAGLFLAGSEPLVVSRSTLQGQLRRRLWRRPLRRIAIRLGAQRLVGDDVLYDGLLGTDFSGTDMRTELAALISATGAVFQAGSAAEARDLTFGAWPRTIALLAGRSPLQSWQGVHADLAARTDRALARVGSAARNQPWGDPESVDRGRAAPFLRDWGPALIRLQEVALEVLV